MTLGEGRSKFIVIDIWSMATFLLSYLCVSLPGLSRHVVVLHMRRNHCSPAWLSRSALNGRVSTQQLVLLDLRVISRK